MWKENQDYLFYEPRNKSQVDLYIINIDGCIIETKSGNLPFEITDYNDWTFIGNVPEILEELNKKFQIALITNIPPGKEKILKKKLDMIREILNLDLWIFGIKNNNWENPKIDFINQIDIKNITLVGNCDTDWSNADLILYKLIKEYFSCNFIKGTDIFNISLPHKSDDNEVIIMLGLNRSKVVSHFESLGYNIRKDIPKKYNKRTVIDNFHPKYLDRKKIIDSIPKNFNYRIVWCINNSCDIENLSELERNNYIENFESPTKSEGVIRKFF